MYNDLIISSSTYLYLILLDIVHRQLTNRHVKKKKKKTRYLIRIYRGTRVYKSNNNFTAFSLNRYLTSVLQL